MKYSLQKRISAFVLAFALVMTTAFNSIGATTKADAAAKVKALYLTSKTATLTVGQTGTAKFGVRATKATKAMAKVTVKSSAPSVVKVGKITTKAAKKTAKAAKKSLSTVKYSALKAGTATITITTKKKTKKTKKFKVTVKEAAATTTQNTPDTTAPASADATTGVIATTEVPASANPLKAVSLSTKTPKVGDVITVVTDPVNASNIKSYKWFADAKEISGEASASYTVKKEDLGKVIKVVVTDKDNVEFSSNETAAVIEDNTQSVTLSVPAGLQADGTALSSDNIQLTYGSGLGLPKNITWYCSDKFVRMVDISGGFIRPDELKWDTTVDGKVPSGTVYVVITNQEGKTFKSNTIEVVDNELPAKITNVTIEEDYSNAANITQADSTGKYVISATINKDYAGKFSVVDNKTNVKKADVKLAAGNANGIVNTATTAGYATVTKDKMNAKTILSTTDADMDVTGTQHVDVSAGNGAFKIVNADKSVTYMFTIAGTGTLKRGTSYKLAFEQTNVAASELKNDENKNAILSDTFVAPYVKAPTTLRVTSVGETLTSVEVKLLTSSSDADVAEYITTSNNKIKFYKNTKYDNTSGENFAPEATMDFAKGVYAKAGLGASDTKYISTYATYEFEKGVCSSEAVSLKSDYHIVPTTRAAKVSISESKTSAKDIFVDLAGLRSSGTVYLFKNVMAKGANTNAGIDNDLLKTVLAKKGTDTNNFVGEATVKIGDGGATFKDAITSLEVGKKCLFVAKFVPDDSSYASGMTDDMATAPGLVVERRATTFELSECKAKPNAEITQVNGTAAVTGSAVWTATNNLAGVTGFTAGTTTSYVRHTSDVNSNACEYYTAKNGDSTSSANEFVLVDNGAVITPSSAALGSGGIAPVAAGTYLDYVPGDVTVKDQFGNAMGTDGYTTELSAGTITANPTTDTNSYTGTGTVKLIVANNTGNVKLVFSDDGSVLTTDSWTVKTTYGTYTIKCTKKGAVKAGNTAGKTAEFSITLTK